MSTAQPPPGYQPQGPPIRPESPFPPIRQKKPWYKRWWAIALFILGGLILLGALLGPDETGPTTAVPAPTVTVTATEQADPEPQPTVTVTKDAPKAESKPKPEPKPDPEPELGEGTYEVGKDVPAGRYKTTVPDDSFGCYWERAKDDSGSLDSIIANDNANTGAKVSVTIKKGEFFKNNGCGEWVRQ